MGDFKIIIGDKMFSNLKLCLIGIAALAFSTGCSGCEDKPTREVETTLNCALHSDCSTGSFCNRERLCEPEPEPAVCTINADCPSRRCDQGQCAPTRRCDEDMACFAGEFCALDGVCVPGCEANVECAAEEVCNEGRCVVGGGCQSDAECGPGGSCNDGQCQVACGENSECGQDGTCFDGLCNSGCTSNTECGAGVCWRGGCVISDPTDPTKPGVDPKDPTDPITDPDPTTTDPDPIDPSAAQDCSASKACGSNERCENGKCVSDEICTGDSQCGPGAYCARGECKLGCDADFDCLDGQSCNIATARCETPGQTSPDSAPSCNASSDCEPCETCIAGECQVVPVVCVTDAQCGLEKSCLDGFCAFDCSSDTQCPLGQKCDAGLCQDTTSNSCANNNDCDSGTCVNGFCFDQCQNDSECGDKLMCDHGVCQPDWRPGYECRNEDDCSAGAACVDGFCTVDCSADMECRTQTCELGYCTQ